MCDERVTLYHGSNMAIEEPDVSLNTGFADLGRGFYLTPDYEAACKRSRKRARREGGEPTVSTFELNTTLIPWVSWGSAMPKTDESSSSDAFGLCFDATRAGYEAWAAYIKACRGGHTEVSGLGSPCVVRAWIATMEVEMVCSGYIDAAAFAEAVDEEELIVQYCLLDQDVLNRMLRFVRSERV